MSSLLRIHRSLLALPSAFHPHHTTPASTGNHFAHLRNPPTRNFSLDGTFASISNSAAVAHVQHGLVQLHDITGLPWWATVVLSTVLMRTLITLPLTVYQHRITARLELITGEMPAIVKELKQETVLAKRQFQLTEKQALALYNRSLKKQWDKLVVRENCHPLKTFCVIWGQIPLWIVQSMALRNVLNMQPDPSALQAQLTFVELTVGGCAWFPNLTEVDGSLIMPVALGLLNLAIIEVRMTPVLVPDYNMLICVFRLICGHTDPGDEPHQRAQPPSDLRDQLLSRLQRGHDPDCGRCARRSESVLVRVQCVRAGAEFAAVVARRASCNRHTKDAQRTRRSVWPFATRDVGQIGISAEEIRRQCCRMNIVCKMLLQIRNQ